MALYDADYKKIMENLKAIADASKEILSHLGEGIILFFSNAYGCPQNWANLLSPLFA